MQKHSLSLLLMVVLLLPSLMEAQRKGKNKVKNNPVQLVEEPSPRLVVGLVIDGMRYDYLTRFSEHYGEGGFKRLMQQGFNGKNHHINYAPSTDGSGLASIYTGTTPAWHGIIGNEWYDKDMEMKVDVVSDSNYVSVGTDGNVGKMSPHRMLTTTITDQHRLHTQMRGKTISVALKDRGAVLSGGHTANAAYWFEGGETGNWVTSSFYMDELPVWVQEFNASDAVEGYKRPWETLKPITQYIESGPDQNSDEGKFIGETTTTFPHDLPSFWEKNGEANTLLPTAYGNSITTDFALALLQNEDLGEDTITDFLTLSYSSTYDVAAKYGVNSVEVQDTYLRLDQDLERLMAVLDTKVGMGKYTLFLTTGRGTPYTPHFLKHQKISSGYLDVEAMEKRFEQFIKYTYGTTDIVKDISNNQVFLDQKVIDNLDMDLEVVQEDIALEILGYEGIANVFTGFQLWKNSYTPSSGIPHFIQQGWHQKRSGDVIFVPKPGYGPYPSTEFPRSSPWIYNTHVPLLFYGYGIQKGETTTRSEVTDIAPTLAVLLGIGFPNGTKGTPIKEVLK